MIATTMTLVIPTWLLHRCCTTMRGTMVMYAVIATHMDMVHVMGTVTPCHEHGNGLSHGIVDGLCRSRIQIAGGVAMVAVTLSAGP